MDHTCAVAARHSLAVEKDISVLYGPGQVGLRQDIAAQAAPVKHSRRSAGARSRCRAGDAFLHPLAVAVVQVAITRGPDHLVLGVVGIAGRPVAGHVPGCVVTVRAGGELVVVVGLAAERLGVGRAADACAPVEIAPRKVEILSPAKAARAAGLSTGDAVQRVVGESLPQNIVTEQRTTSIPERAKDSPLEY